MTVSRNGPQARVSDRRDANFGIGAVGINFSRAIERTPRTARATFSRPIPVQSVHAV